MFTTKYEQQRQQAYPNAQDPNFLGFDRAKDRWKVDASGIKVYASGIEVDLDYQTDSVSIWSASGTAPIPVYIDGQIPIAVSVDIESDSIKIFSSSGTPQIPVYIPEPISIKEPLQVEQLGPTEEQLLKRRLTYDTDGDIIAMKVVPIATPSGSQCKLYTYTYDSNKDVDYIVESLSTW